MPQSLGRQIAFDTVKFTASAAAVGLGMMATRKPEYDDLPFHWNGTTFGFALLGGLIASAIVAVFRWRMSRAQ